MKTLRCFRAQRPIFRLSAALVLALVWAGTLFARPASAQLQRAISLFRSPRNFVALPSDARVRYEPGAEAWAQMIAPLMDHAVQTIEERQYRPFAKPVQVYVCASEDSYYRLSGARSKAVVTTRLFLSPRLFEDTEHLDAYLTHELSHLHLHQRIGLIGCASLPVWFNEGLATLVSDGGGAHLASEEQALAAIRDSRHFTPDRGSPLRRRDNGSFGLEPHLFYRQAMMFVGSMRESDEGAFRAMLLSIEDGQSFSRALKGSYRQSLDQLWADFLDECRRPIR